MLKFIILSLIGFALTLTQTAFAQEKLNGTFMEPGHVPTSKIPQFFDELKSLQMDTVILSRFYSKVKQTNTDSCYVDSWLAEKDFSHNVQTSKLTTILNELQNEILKSI